MPGRHDRRREGPASSGGWSPAEGADQGKGPLRDGVVARITAGVEGTASMRRGSPPTPCQAADKSTFAPDGIYLISTA